MCFPFFFFLSLLLTLFLSLSPHSLSLSPCRCFRLLANSEDRVTSRWSRRLLTYEKLRDPAEGEEDVDAFVVEGMDSYTNFAAKVLNDPNRNDERCVSGAPMAEA